MLGCGTHLTKLDAPKCTVSLSGKNVNQKVHKDQNIVESPPILSSFPRACGLTARRRWPLPRRPSWSRATGAGRATCPSSLTPGTQFNRNKWLEFRLENGLRFHFDSVTCLNYPFLNIFLVCGISSQISSDYSSQNSRQTFSIELGPRLPCAGRAGTLS